MELKDLLGSDFREGMTLEEVTAALANKSFVDKKTFDDTASQLAKEKKTSKAASDDFSAQLAAQQNEIKSLKISNNRQSAARIFAEAGLSSAEYTPMLDGIVTEDGEAGNKLATSIASLMKARETALETKYKSAQIDNAPAPNGNSPQKMTKEVFDKMSVTERMKYKADNPESYKALTGGK